MVDVICDTSFLIHLATKRIQNISELNSEIGQLTFIVPTIVISELKKLSNDISKKNDALDSLEYIESLKKINLSGKLADDAIVSHVKDNGGMVATLDKELKKRVKQNGGSILSLSKNHIILEN